MDTTTGAPVAPDLRAAPEIVITGRGWRDFPYWLVAIGLLFVWMGYLVVTQDRYNLAYDRIIVGLGTTLSATVVGFGIACVLGLLAGLGRIAKNLVVRNVALFYIEFVRGVPIIVLLLMIAFTVVPTASDWLGFSNQSVSLFMRGVIALALIYGAFLAEVFRAGIESVPRGQTEAGRSLGMSNVQTMRRIVLPQAIRNMLPAIGNDLIAMLKDSALLSFLAVREMTHRGRLLAGATFDYPATYMVLTFLYLVMTVGLSLLLRVMENRLRSGSHV
jgi:polar amino acid transport system permease protein